MGLGEDREEPGIPRERPASVQIRTVLQHAWAEFEQRFLSGDEAHYQSQVAAWASESAAQEAK